MATYAIGDIHGCRALLAALLDAIEEHAAGRAYRLVTLGDYIDRGPDSAGVIATLRDLQADRGPSRVRCLMGNHEDLCLRARGDPRAFDLWIANGGDATLASFGAQDLSGVPADVLAWMAALPAWAEDPWRIFVHAGLSPRRPVGDQDPHDLLWIRDPFLLSGHDFGRLVVHGHTPRIDGMPDEHPTRLNLDTAAVFGGRLTAAAFASDQARPLAFIQVAAATGGVSVTRPGRSDGGPAA